MIISIPDTLLVTMTGITHLLLHLLHISVTIILPAVRTASGTTAQTGIPLLTALAQDIPNAVTPTDRIRVFFPIWLR